MIYRNHKYSISMKRLFHLFLIGWCVALPPLAQSQSEYSFKRTEDIIYGRKFGTVLTLDIIQPQNTNGIGILFMVSGGFISSHQAINPGFYKPLLDRGYTVFAVVHGAQPKFIIPEIEQDIHR